MARILALARLTATGALLMSVCAGSAAPDPHTQVVLAAGADGGNYLRLAKAIQEQSTSRNLQITVLTTAGSMENIGLLEAKRADFAFVQSDISRLASLGHRPFSQPLKNLRIVTPLFTEVVQVLVRSDLYVFSTEELRGKVVSFGPKGSGTEGTTRAVLEASGVSINEVNQRDVSLEETDQQLQDETIEVAFLTSAVPTPSVALALREHDARLLLLDGKVIERLAGSGSYVGTAIPRGTYDNQPDEIPTVGVEALLLSRDDYAPETVSLLLQVLRSRRKEIERVAGVQMDLLGSAGPPNSLIPPHEGVKGYLRSDSGSWLPVAAVGLAVSVLVALVLAKRQLVRTLLAHNREVLLALFVLAVVWVLGSGGLFYYERHVNQYFHSFFRSMWSLLVYIAGGFQTRHPITHGGEIVAVLSIVLGLGVVTWFIAELAGHFVKSALVFALLGRDRVPENTEHHIVIVNWDHRAESMIRELHGPDLPKKRPIVVISRDTFEFPSDPEFRNCSRVVGEPTDIQHLKRARVAHAESVTILSAWRNSDQSDRRQTLDANAADGKTILTILGIRTVCSEAVPVRQVPITAEIRSGSNVGSAQTAGRGGLTEIVCAERFGAEVLTQCAWTPGLAALYEDLLTFEPGTNEIYKIKAPKNCINKVFSEVLHQFAATREDKAYAAIPIAIYRDGKVYLNPPDDDPESGVLREGDYLFVIADHAPVGL